MKRSLASALFVSLLGLLIVDSQANAAEPVVRSAVLNLTSTRALPATNVGYRRYYAYRPYYAAYRPYYRPYYRRPYVYGGFYAPYGGVYYGPRVYRGYPGPYYW